MAKATPHTDKSLRVPEIAERLGVTPIAVLKQIQKRGLVARKDANGHWLVDENSVRAYEARRQERIRPETRPRPSVSAPERRLAVMPLDGSNHPRRRATDLFPEFRLTIDTGDMAIRITAIENEVRAIRQMLEART